MKPFALALLAMSLAVFSSCSEENTQNKPELLEAMASPLLAIPHSPPFVQKASPAVVLGGFPWGPTGSHTAFFTTLDEGATVLVSTADGPSTCAREGCVRQVAFDFQKGLPPRYISLVIKPLIHHPSWGVTLFQAYQKPLQNVPLLFKILGANQPFVPPLSLALAPSPPQEGDTVAAVGHPFGALKRATLGPALATSAKSFAIEAPMAAGQGAGWPVVDTQGRLQGLVISSGDNALFGEEGVATQPQVMPASHLQVLYNMAQSQGPKAANAFVSLNDTFDTFGPPVFAQLAVLGIARLKGLNPDQLNPDAYKQGFHKGLLSYFTQDLSRSPGALLSQITSFGPCSGALEPLDDSPLLNHQTPWLGCLTPAMAKLWLPTIQSKLKTALQESGQYPAPLTAALVAPFHFLPTPDLLEAYGGFVLAHWHLLAREHKAFVALRLAMLTGRPRIQGRLLVDCALDFSNLRLQRPTYLINLLALEGQLERLLPKGLIKETDVQRYHTSLESKYSLYEKTLNSYLKLLNEKNDYLKLYPISK